MATIAGVCQCSTRSASPEAGGGAVGLEIDVSNKKNSIASKRIELLSFRRALTILLSGL